MYSPFVTLELLQGPIYAMIRSIGQQKEMIYGQIISNYIVHFIVLGVGLSVSDERNEIIVIACACTFTIFVVYGIG